MKAILIIGPQGSGKGTQAELIARKLNIFHFDTGQYLRTVLYDPALQKDKTIQKERKLNKAGILNTPSWILKTIVQVIKRTASFKQGIVFSGSPRTFYEAFGYNKNENSKKKTDGLIDVLKKYYGKKNIFIFLLNLPLEESIKRISGRFTCVVCSGPLLAQKNKYKSCPFCGGKIMKRKDDTKKSIMERLAEYERRTKPILKKLKKDSYQFFEIDGRPAPYKIHQMIYQKIEKS